MQAQSFDEPAILNLDNEGVAAAQRFADAAGEVAALVRGGVVALSELPPDVDIEQAANAVRERIGEEYPELRDRVPN